MSPWMLDAALGIVMLGYALLGMRRGLVMGLLDLAGWLSAVLVCLSAAAPVTDAVARVMRWPHGLVALVVLLGLLVVTYGLATLATLWLYDRLLRPRIRGRFVRIDALLGVLPGALDGAMLFGIGLAFLLASPFSGWVSPALPGSRFAKPLSLLAERVGDPFESAVQDAAFNINGFLTKREGEAPTRLKLPVTEMTTDSAAEKQMLDLLNAERVKRGLVALVVDARLTQVARQHSEEMLRMGYFAHDSPALGSPFDRMARAGIRYKLAGENLALAPSVERAHVGLMNSPEHRDNILRPEFRKIGIGAVNGGLAGQMFTQDFIGE